MRSASRIAHIAFGLLIASLFAACTLAYPTSELANGAASTGAGGGQAQATTALASGSVNGTSSGAGGSCAVASCDDANPCTTDACGPSGCVNTVTKGLVCGVADDCNPAPTCSAAGVCEPGQPDSAKCDDANACTIDACQPSGCTHSGNTGAPCNDGNSCDQAGSCSASGACIAAPVAVIETCVAQVSSCKPGYYYSSIYCDPNQCGGTAVCTAGFGVNAANCSWACGQSFTLCCGTTCVCPTMYNVASAVMTNVPQCNSGTAVTCSL